MSDKKELNTDILIADIMLRLTALEKLLIEKGLLTQAELATTTDELAKRVAKVVLEKVQASKQVEEFVADLEKSTGTDKKGLDN